MHTQPHTMHTQMYPHRMYIQMLSNYTLAHISVDMHSHAVYMQHIHALIVRSGKEDLIWKLPA